LNYLAHAYLSFQDPEILVGNMISDFVKGKKKFDYPPGIQKGIQLHRQIDQFTDKHPMTKKAQIIFREHYRLYSGAFVDVSYDYFLANDKAVFSNSEIASFTKKTYSVLDQYQELFPGKFAMMFPYMKEQDWLFNYQYRWGIEKSFGGLVRRAAFMNEHETAFRLFEENIDELQTCYNIFFPELKVFALNQFKLLTDF
jgi:acyl carrier protein phosphodiesterase